MEEVDHMYFRLSPNGYDVSGDIQWFASATPYDPPRGVLHRTLHNQAGNIGPLPGDMARSAVGLINGDLGSVVGDREAGLGRSWERLHMIGVSAGILHERRYSNFNTVIGSHALNTAMIPFEGIANWVLRQDRSFYYIVNVDEQKTLRFTDRQGNTRLEPVPTKMRQAITYTSEFNPNIWITLRQAHEDTRTIALNPANGIDYSAGITDDLKMRTSNWQAIYGQIAAIDQQVLDAQRNDIWNLQPQ
ncbi:hypothetical protein [Agaribacterium sp. ZY112]|uniref:hypothetical protein n=1 Tax=Agaribacterium sp. ZY112 TaxID=3233574 RepID=UPI0035261240